MIHGHPQGADEVLVPGELGSDDREDVPVVLLHDGQHQQSFLLQGRAKLEERGLLILHRHRDSQSVQSVSDQLDSRTKVVSNVLVIYSSKV